MRTKSQDQLKIVCPICKHVVVQDTDEAYGDFKPCRHARLFCVPGDMDPGESALSKKRDVKVYESTLKTLETKLGHDDVDPVDVFKVMERKHGYKVIVHATLGGGCCCTTVKNIVAFKA